MKREIIKKINENIPVIIATDTIYGISMINSIENKVKINLIKKSKNEKDLITLFSSFKQIKSIVNVDKNIKKIFKKSKKTTYICNALDEKKIALRYVKGYIAKIIKKTGPLYSTSANYSGMSYIEDINIFKKLVGSKNVYYKKSKGNISSKIIDISSFEVIR